MLINSFENRVPQIWMLKQNIGLKKEMFCVAVDSRWKLLVFFSAEMLTTKLFNIF